MNQRLLIVAALFLAITVSISAQNSRMLPWSQPNQQNLLVYRPEPILFVHGVNANDGGWQAAINALRVPFGYYQEPNSLPVDYAQQRATQFPYLHTFNYGDRPGANTLNRQTFDPIIWNAWDADLRATPVTNIFHNPPVWGPFPDDTRTTLDRRIDEVRRAYALNQQDPTTYPPLVLVAHSLGALLSHHYMLRAAPNPPVRRLVTVAGAHQGSLLANWMTWYMQSGGNPASSFDGHQVPGVIQALRWAAQDEPFGPTEASSFFRHWNHGSMQDAMMLNESSVFTTNTSPLLTSFWNTPAPRLEYVFNVYLMPPGTNSVAYSTLRRVVHDSGVDPVFLAGDGFVPGYSATGKDGPNSPSIWNGATNVNPNVHGIDPVLFGWLNTDHSAAVSHTNSLLQSLFGVPYRWPGTMNDWPFFTQIYGENQSFSKYLPALTNNTVAHTDEPGINDTVLLCPRAGRNPLLIPSISTWATNGAIWTKAFTNQTALPGRQIAAGNASAIRVVGIVGCKNHSAAPVLVNGTNYCVLAGNEYLPASLSLRVSSGVETQAVAISTNALAGAARAVTNCLVHLGAAGDVQFQYGSFETNGIPITTGTNNFVAVQGYNLAGLLTPQAERAFDVPVDSATVLGILTNINAREAMSNACHAGTEPTRWTNAVSEWLTITNAGSYPLNFFPVSIPTALADAWTGTNLVDGWFYDATNNAVVVTNMDALSTHVIASNVVWLGTATGFSNVLGGVTNFVPALTNADTLAGLPVNEAWLTEMRDRLAAVVPKFRDITTNACAPWTLTNVLAAVGNNSGTWSPVPGGLLSPAHFTELASVANLLTTLDDCSCQRVTAFLCEGRIGNASTNHWWDGTFEADVTHTNTGAPVVKDDFPWFSAVYSPIEVRYDGAARQVDFRLFTNATDYISLVMDLRAGVFTNAPGCVANLNFRVAARTNYCAAYLDNLQLVCDGTTNAIGNLGTSFETGEQRTMTVSNLPLQAGFTLLGNARFDWTDNPLPQNSKISFQITADEAP